jgi:hypothetical protein
MRKKQVIEKIQLKAQWERKEKEKNSYLTVKNNDNKEKLNGGTGSKKKIK